MLHRTVQAYKSILQRSPLLTNATLSAVLFSVGDAVSQRAFIGRHGGRPSGDHQTLESNPKFAASILQASQIGRDGGRPVFDWARNFRMAAFGACVSAPAHLGWFHLVETLPFAAKVSLHTLFFAPVQISAFNAYMASWETFDRSRGAVAPAPVPQFRSSSGGLLSRHMQQHNVASCFTADLGDQDDVAHESGRPLWQDYVQNAQERIERKTFAMWKVGTGYWVPVVLGNFFLVSLPNRVLVTNVANLGWTVYLSLMGNEHQKIRPAQSSAVTHTI